MFEKLKVSMSDEEVQKEEIRCKAYNKGLEDGKSFATFYIIEAIRNARFNQSSVRSGLPKNSYFTQLDELLNVLDKTLRK